jgi:1-deoxy-D-xylulose 5-phosphate reductoisomerase
VHAIVQYSKKKLMFVSKPDMKLSIYQALTQFKKTSMHVITYDRKYQLEKIDSKK